jgi:hypothetical protein
MNRSSRTWLSCAAALGALAVMAVASRQLAHVGLPTGSLRIAMFLFTLLCPVLLGLAIGVWGGHNAGQWGARGVGATYLGVVGWAWLEAGAFPVGFHLEGFQTPLFVTLVNTGIFLMTVYFMQALGRTGGRLGARFVADPSWDIASPSVEPSADRLSPPMSDAAGADHRVSS